MELAPYSVILLFGLAGGVPLHPENFPLGNKEELMANQAVDKGRMGEMAFVQGSPFTGSITEDGDLMLRHRHRNRNRHKSRNKNATPKQEQHKQEPHNHDQHNEEPFHRRFSADDFIPPTSVYNDMMLEDMELGPDAETAEVGEMLEERSPEQDPVQDTDSAEVGEMLEAQIPDAVQASLPQQDNDGLMIKQTKIKLHPLSKTSAASKESFSASDDMAVVRMTRAKSSELDPARDTNSAEVGEMLEAKSLSAVQASLPQQDNDDLMIKQTTRKLHPLSKSSAASKESFPASDDMAVVRMKRAKSSELDPARDTNSAEVGEMLEAKSPSAVQVSLPQQDNDGLMIKQAKKKKPRPPSKSSAASKESFSASDDMAVVRMKRAKSSELDPARDTDSEEVGEILEAKSSGANPASLPQGANDDMMIKYEKKTHHPLPVASKESLPASDNMAVFRMVETKSSEWDPAGDTDSAEVGEMLVAERPDANQASLSQIDNDDMMIKQTTRKIQTPSAPVKPSLPETANMVIVRLTKSSEWDPLKTESAEDDDMLEAKSSDADPASLPQEQMMI